MLDVHPINPRVAATTANAIFIVQLLQLSPGTWVFGHQLSPTPAEAALCCFTLQD